MTSTADQKYSDYAGFQRRLEYVEKEIDSFIAGIFYGFGRLCLCIWSGRFYRFWCGATMESVTENEWDEDCFSDTEDGDFTSEESGDALFSDEKEIPAVQNGEVCIENAGQGMTAGTSVYNSKSSFGRRKPFLSLLIWEIHRDPTA